VVLLKDWGIRRTREFDLPFKSSPASAFLRPDSRFDVYWDVSFGAPFEALALLPRRASNEAFISCNLSISGLFSSTVCWRSSMAMFTARSADRFKPAR
jgi:hypothetical protein